MRAWLQQLCRKQHVENNMYMRTHTYTYTHTYTTHTRMPHARTPHISHAHATTRLCSVRPAPDCGVCARCDITHSLHLDRSAFESALCATVCDSSERDEAGQLPGCSRRLTPLPQDAIRSLDALPCHRYDHKLNKVNYLFESALYFDPFLKLTYYVCPEFMNTFFFFYCMLILF